LYILPNASTHGTDGYVHVSYPRYFYNQYRGLFLHPYIRIFNTGAHVELFLDGLQELGIPILFDPNNGIAAGGMLIPNSINPDNQTRSDARTAYYDGFINTRPNFHVATGQHATRVLINTPLNVWQRGYPAGFWISGVEVCKSFMSRNVANIDSS
jgi:choline dehydrogenase